MELLDTQVMMLYNDYVGKRLWRFSPPCTSPGAITSNPAHHYIERVGIVSDAIIVALISAVVTILSIFISAKATQDKTEHKLDTNQQVMTNEMNHIKSEMAEMKDDIKAHNQYAKLFNENIPVIKEKIDVANNRIKDLEHIAEKYHG